MSPARDPHCRARLEKAVSKLPRLQREIFLAHRLDGLSYPEIASRTGLSVSRVERHVARALYKIARQVDGDRLRWWERLF